MTTIAGCAKLGILVSDSQVADGDMKWSETKVRRINGGLYAAAGESADTEKFFEYAERGCKGRRPKLEDGFQALALTARGLLFYDARLHPTKMDQQFAVGTGGKCVLSALLAGADIVRAVEIACEVDAASSRPVQTFHLDEKVKSE